MIFQDNHGRSRALYLALVVSLLLHGLILLVPRVDPAGGRAPQPLAVRLPPRVEAARDPVAEPESVSSPRTKKQPARSTVMSTARRSPVSTSAQPQWSAAERAEMGEFLEELDREARMMPRPTLAQRSAAMAHAYARQAARQEAQDSATLELKPNAPPPSPFSLEMYVDGLIRRLNRSAGFVRNDPRSKGVKNASVQFKLNPDGSLNSFTVLNAGDQQEEIAFIKSVIERSIPFAPFPEDIDRAAKTLNMKICIRPGAAGSGEIGFSRADGRTC